MKRPELTHGVIEFVAPQEYMVCIQNTGKGIVCGGGGNPTLYFVGLPGSTTSTGCNAFCR
jgi:hypothetical protein